MVAMEITILVIWFLLYIVFRSVNIYFGSVLVFITFIFAFIVSNQQFSSFYLLLYLITIVLDVVIVQINTTSQTAQSFKAGQFSLKGFRLIMVMLITGLVIYMGINLVSKHVGGNIIGVPNLAITTTSEIGKSFKPTFESALGIIENQFAFVLFDILFNILLVFGLLIPIIGIFIELLGLLIPLLVASLILAIFHVVAYSVSIGLMLYAMIAFMVFILTKVIFNDSLPADTGHYLNNAVYSLSRSLAVVR